MRVDYIDHMGSDLSCVNAARVSFDKESAWVANITPETERLTKETGEFHFHGLDLQERDKKLVSYLATHGHFTPFTHTAITLRETVPIFVARQRFKHTVGFSYNEVSRRYVDDEPEFYTPGVWRSRPGESIKQGSGEALDVDTEVYVKEDYRQAVEKCQEVYEFMLRQGVAPEQARMVLPQSMMTSYHVTGSLAAFARAYKLRMDPHAQLEIQELATQWGNIIQPLFPVAWLALTE